MRVEHHPVLGDAQKAGRVTIWVDGKPLEAIEDEPIAAALLANGIRVMRHTPRFGEPRGLFCGIGRCTDCIMTVNGVPNIRTCVTLVEAGMAISSGKEGAVADERNA